MKFISGKMFISTLAAMSLVLSEASFATIALSATRVIFNAGDNEAQITVKNGPNDLLVQSWLEPLEEAQEAKDKNIPFSLTPQLARLRANQNQLLRIMYEGVGLPQDRESAYWLTVQEIPVKSSNGNNLQLAAMIRVKTFYRPVGLPANADKAIENLQWSISADGKELIIDNPSAYYVNAGELKVNSLPLAASAVVAPYNKRIIKLNKDMLKFSDKSILYNVINDFGGVEQFSVTIKSQERAPQKPIRKVNQ